MSHDEGAMSTKEKLVYMANQIATFFHSQPRDEAANGVADHINKFWEPRMRRQFFEMVDAGGKGFDALVLEAAPKIRRPKPADNGAGRPEMAAPQG